LLVLSLLVACRAAAAPLTPDRVDVVVSVSPISAAGPATAILEFGTFVLTVVAIMLAACQPFLGLGRTPGWSVRADNSTVGIDYVLRYTSSEATVFRLLPSPNDPRPAAPVVKSFSINPRPA
jgi:hypothetical protein